MSQATRDQFVQDVLADAYAAASHLAIPVSVVLAQWCNETGHGTSRAWVEGHNYAGVSQLEGLQRELGARYNRDGKILYYPNRQNGLAGYIARWAEPVYADTRAAWAEHGHDAYQVAHDVELSPWAGGHYGGNGLRRLLMAENLTRFDGKVPPVPSTDGQETPCAALPAGPSPGHLRTLKVGMRGDDVAVVQTILRDRGVVALHTFGDTGVPDGIFGSETAQAVATFQTQQGLHRDGIVGVQTWCALGRR